MNDLEPTTNKKKRGRRPLNRGVERAQIEVRRGHVATMMLAKMTQVDMARKLGVSESTIHEDVKAVREDWAMQRQRVYDHFDEDLATIERILAELFPQALNLSFDHLDRLGQWLDRKGRRLQYDTVNVVVTRRGDREPEEMTDAEIAERLIELKKEGEADIEEFIASEVERRLNEVLGDDDELP